MFLGVRFGSLRAVTAISMLSLTLLLAVAAWWMSRTPTIAGGPQQPSWLTTLESTPLTGIRLETPGRTFDLDRRDGRWFLRGDTHSQWPVEEQRVRSLLRLLAQVGNASPGIESQSSSSVALTLTASDLRQYRLSVSQRPIGGGSVVVTEDDPPGSRATRISSEPIADVFTAAGIAAWRAKSLLSPETTGASQIRMEALGQRLTLNRVQTRWMAVEPVQTTTSSNACASLAAQLQRLEAASWLGDPDAAAITWTASPTTYIRVESDLPTVPRTRLIQEVRVGGPAESSGKLLIAAVQATWEDPATNVRTPAWGPLVCTVAASSIEALPMRIEQFARPTPLETVAADIGSLWLRPCDHEPLNGDIPKPAAESDSTDGRFGKVGLKRTLDGWLRQDLASTAQRLDESSLSSLKKFVGMLAEDQGGHVLLGPPTGTQCIGWLVVSDIRGQPRECLGLGACRGLKGGPFLVMRAGSLWYAFAGADADRAIEWLSTLIPAEG